MAEQEVEQCDVAVIGGGPGGSTAAALLARRGYKVIALEKAHHPRFHIGESLLPMNLPVFERLGVLDKVRELGVFKPGADFEADNARGYNTYAFARAIGQSPPHAYQVWRQDFDRMLYGHARESGADAREGHEVVRVEQRGPRESWLDVRTDDGRGYAIQARYVVDASGRDALLATKRKLRRRNDQHQSAAIFGHFRGAARREDEDAGNISIYSFAHGWMWMIPLPDGVMSVGAVCRPDYLKQRKGRTVEFLFDTLKLSPALWARVQHAELIDDEVRVTGNYSYDASRMGGAGWVLVGDAFAFLDPVFSSGVYLAMSGAEQAAAVVDQALREPQREPALLRRLEKRQRAGMARFSFFIYRFNGPVMQQMFRQPRNTWQLEQGVISMLAGDLFDTPKVLWRLKLFKLVYAICFLRDWRRSRAEHRYRLAQARAQFTGGNTPLDEV
ncbi:MULTISPECIES: NAD(P)/FAD-dependent oxidoreductase [unclassified Rhodanobacter]|uniref:NAD(P)/FAD-dependent oxidoreductase n=1 Tax=unclassified Rhodanobacter TaxID=2621553 RepID=UPI001BDF64A5|nr:MULTISPECIES: NAD(P)/FAD-dependent oxidoreductase [unclassified Rhodanobacter]MBT2143791.1 tryptophan 7-halogenase [Rhodanobacter sp. LX-99]MBT2147135.1 tryptophan 7-halogenase [Rhodanobacter sp. LX-100]